MSIFKGPSHDEVYTAENIADHAVKHLDEWFDYEYIYGLETKEEIIEEISFHFVDNYLENYEHLVDPDMYPDFLRENFDKIIDLIYKKIM